MTEFKLDLSDMQAAMATQIIASLTAEAREKIIGEAVTALIAPGERDNYGRKEVTPSALTVAFNNAVRNMAGKIATELIEANPEVERRVREAAGMAIITWMEDDLNLTGILAEALTASFRDKIRPSSY